MRRRGRTLYLGLQVCISCSVQFGSVVVFSSVPMWCSVPFGCAVQFGSVVVFSLTAQRDFCHLLYSLVVLMSILAW